MKTVGQKIEKFNVVGVKPGFNKHEENDVSAFEPIDEDRARDSGDEHPPGAVLLEQVEATVNPSRSSGQHHDRVGLAVVGGPRQHDHERGEDPNRQRTRHTRSIPPPRRVHSQDEHGGECRQTDDAQVQSHLQQHIMHVRVGRSRRCL